MMVKNTISRLTFLMITILLHSVTTVIAQNANSITQKDKESIIKISNETIKSYVDLIDFVGDPNNDNEQKNSYIASCISGGRSFMKANAQIENDLSNNIDITNASQSDFKDYINGVRLAYVKNERNSTFSVFDISCIKYTNEVGIYIEVPFTHTLSGIDGNSKVNYSKKSRMATISLSKNIKGEWKATINNVVFYKPADMNSLNCMVISDAETSNDLVEVETKSTEYYAYKLVQGDRLTKENKFEEAYIAYKEASLSDEFDEDAEEKMTALFDLMRKSNIEGVNEYLCKRIAAKAKDMDFAYKYDNAYMLFSFARELNPSYANIMQSVKNSSDNLKYQRQLDGYFTGKSYSQGVTEYTKAIGDDPNNPNNYIGRAKCYYMLRKNFDATNDFLKARSLDPSNPNVYLWQGKHFEEMYRKVYYDSAYASYITYVNKSEDDKSPDVRAVYARAIYCQGLKLMNMKRNEEAIVSFKKAIEIVPTFEDAYCYAGVCLIQMNKIDEAKKSLKKAIQLNEQYADAHYWYAIAMSQTVKDFNKNYDLIFKEWETALKYKPNMGNWCIQLGNMLKAKGDNLGAINYFDKALLASPTNFLAHLYKARCNKAINSMAEARDNYSKYVDNLKKWGDNVSPSIQKEIDEITIVTAN